MTEEEDENKRVRPRERARGQKLVKSHGRPPDLQTALSDLTSFLKINILP